MKKALFLLGALALAASVHALPTYDAFSTYGASGALLGGNTAPSGESWIAYTNETLANLVAGANVCITNYFTTHADTLSAPLPANFPGPFVSENDTSTNSVWTPGYLGANTPLGGVGACLQLASPVANVAGNKIFVSFFADVPAVVGGGDSYGQGQSEGYGWTAGFLPASQLPGPPGANQNEVPSVFEKFNARANAASNPMLWKPGVGFNDATSGAGLASAGSGVSPATIHFIVLDYEFNGGTGTDVERIWLDPATANFGLATQPASSASTSPTAATSLATAGGFFFLAYCQNDAALPPFGIIYNSLRIGTNWAYVTGGPQFTSYAPATTNIASGNTLVLNSTAVAGGVPVTYTWANSSGPLTLGGRFSVGPAGALTIANVQAGDADTYTLQVSTPITTENSVPPATAQTVVTVTPSPPVFTSENAIGSGQFQMNFSGPVGFSYRIWAAANLALTPVTSTWNQVSAGVFTSGVNTFTDTSATNSAEFYVITVP
jgi:hypothetical protein